MADVQPRVPALVHGQRVEPAPSGRELMTAFLAGRTEHTLRAYRRDLISFAVFRRQMGSAAALEDLLGHPPGEANAILLAYRAHMIERGLAPTTLNRRLAAVRSAVKAARLIGYTTWVPEVPGVKVRPFRDTRGPGLDGVQRMLEHASAARSPKAERDSAILRLLFDLGLRCSEVCALDLDSIDTAGMRLRIRGKGHAEDEWRTLPPQTLAALLAWVAVRPAHLEETALFVSLSGPTRRRRLSARGLHHLVASLGAGTGIKTRPHGVRHASVTAALDVTNGDVRAVQQHARHASPQTTLAYDDNRRDLAGRIAMRLAGLTARAPRAAEDPDVCHDADNPLKSHEAMATRQAG